MRWKSLICHINLWQIKGFASSTQVWQPYSSPLQSRFAQPGHFSSNSDHTIDKMWYPNSEATHHITNDMSNLNNVAEYTSSS